MTSVGVNHERQRAKASNRADYAPSMSSSTPAIRLSESELDLRPAALRAGVWLGWLSVGAVLAGLALGLPARHQAALLGATAVAAIANGVVMAVPRNWWTTQSRGERMLAVWSAGLLTLTAVLVLLAGARANLDLLLFLILPFLATVHAGRCRIRWLGAALVTFAAVSAAAPDRLSAGQVALRSVLLLAATLLALVLADLTRRTATARAELNDRAELERLLLAEAHHRVKNSLQTVADLILLGRPEGAHGKAFDETAGRIHAIAGVHRLLAEQRGGDVTAAALLELVCRGLAPDARIQATELHLDATCAQHLGIVANELVSNAVQHGQPPIEIELRHARGLTLSVRDHGPGPNGAHANLGLQLVSRVVDQGLHGSFVLRRDGQDRTEALVTFDPERACAS